MELEYAHHRIYGVVVDRQSVAVVNESYPDVAFCAVGNSCQFFFQFSLVIAADTGRLSAGGQQNGCDSRQE